jgi:hypothetical protein
VPNADLIYKNDQQMQRFGTVHYPCHMHNPYDTIELVREMGDVFERMARTALVAALGTGQDAPNLRVAPPPEQRVVFVASHTEVIHMAPTTFTDIGMLFDLNGFDVDMVPYGQPVSPADMEAELVIVLPVVDYASPDGDVDVYDEAWSQPEIAVLESYVAQGGLLVLTNSAYRLRDGNWRMKDSNEDWPDANALAQRFGVSYQAETLAPGSIAQIQSDHPLVKGEERLMLVEGNGVPFTLDDKGQVLATLQDEPVAALVDYGDAGGQVLILADVGILGSGRGEPANVALWKKLAEYARSH